MPALKDTLRADMTEAMRARDELTVATLRMALAAITTEEVSGASARTLTDAEVIAVLGKEAKKRRESSAAFTAGGRPELAAREDAELAVLGRYLPAPLSEQDVAAMVEDVVAGLAAQGVTGMPAMGRAMKELSARVAGRFDGGRLAAMVRAALG